MFGFTLTLAAIAGLVLTIGMAVDANVLIFERMKEESRLGKTMQAVVSHGFSRAFTAILDSNVTTIIAALVLTQLAKGSIQGFAVTLLIGNLATLFCRGIRLPARSSTSSLTCSRRRGSAHLEKDRMKRVIQFSRARYYFFGFSALLILIGIVGLHREPRTEPRRRLQGRHRIPVPGGPGELHRPVQRARTRPRSPSRRESRRSPRPATSSSPSRAPRTGRKKNYPVPLLRLRDRA